MQGMQLRPMSGDLLPVDNESSEGGDEEMEEEEEEEEEEMVAVAHASKKRSDPPPTRKEKLERKLYLNVEVALTSCAVI